MRLHKQNPRKYFSEKCEDHDPQRPCKRGLEEAAAYGKMRAGRVRVTHEEFDGSAQGSKVRVRLCRKGA
jgi:hypothetical protein